VYSKNYVLHCFGSAIDEIREHISPIALSSGQVLLEPGEAIKRVYFLSGGLVSARVPFENGDEVECVLLGRNTAIGALSAIGLDSAVTRAVCLFDAHAWTIPVAPLRAAVRRLPDIERVIQICCGSQMSFSLLVGACNAMHGAERRLARWLLLANDLVDGTPLRIRQEELGTILGVQRTVINPLLQKFQAEGMISTGRGRVAVLDAEGLRDRACDCHIGLQRLTAALSPERGPGCCREQPT
jgi:CRP-like cAMP-binding protein